MDWQAFLIGMDVGLVIAYIVIKIVIGVRTGDWKPN